MKDRNTPAHGYELTPEQRDLLRSVPPARALRWVKSAVGGGAQVNRVRALEGGTSSAIHAVDVRDSGDRMHRLVLRRFVREDWREEEPDAPEREAAALEIVRGSRLATPTLIALDRDGSEVGVPAVLMTRVVGEVDWHPTNLERFLRQLAEALPLIHALARPSGARIPAYDPYELRMSGPPPSSRCPEVWSRAIEAFDQSPPSAERFFIHRDYHPGNVLWSKGELTGVVDWVHASVGSPDADAGHCRANLAGWFGLEAADRFLDLYLAVSGRSDYHAYWDVAAVLGGRADEDFLNDTELDEEPFLARAVSRL
jgi:aminoglycoside phosphotransferase (APT) family kinase protein